MAMETAAATVVVKTLATPRRRKRVATRKMPLLRHLLAAIRSKSASSSEQLQFDERTFEDELTIYKLINAINIIKLP
jgi:hypothetical protein